jgi:hypothetical protein
MLNMCFANVQQRGILRLLHTVANDAEKLKKSHCKGFA